MGRYVIRFHNGEEADAVPKSQNQVSHPAADHGLQQIVSGSFLIFLVVEPAWLCLFASNPTINGDAWWEAAATVILLPLLLLIALIWVVAILLQMLLLYLRDGREAGPCLIIKIAMFYLSAPLFLFIFCCVALNGPTAGTDGRRHSRRAHFELCGLSGRGGVRGVDRKADVRLFNNGRRRTLVTLPDPHQFMVRPRPARAVGLVRRVPDR